MQSGSKKLNPLQPRFAVPARLVRDLPENPSLSAFLEWAEKYLCIFDAMVGAKQVEDMRRRAVALAEKVNGLPADQEPTVVTMDGHGRFIIRFLQEVSSLP